MAKIEFYESTKVVFIERSLIYNEAYLKLTGKSCQVLAIIFSRRVFHKSKTRGIDIYFLKNNGKIRITYNEMKKHSISPYQFDRAIDELCNNGFINANGSIDERNIKVLHFTLLDNYKNYGEDNFRKGKRVKAPNMHNSSEQRRDLNGRFKKNENRISNRSKLQWRTVVNSNG